MSDNNNNNSTANPIEASANKIKKKAREALNGKSEAKLVEGKKMLDTLQNLIASMVEDYAAVGVTLDPAAIFKTISEM